MTSDARRFASIRHDGKLLGWSVGLQGDRLCCRHERGAQFVWPWPRTDQHEQVLLEILRAPVPKSPEAEAADREMQRRREEVREFYQAKMGGQRLDR